MRHKGKLGLLVVLVAILVGINLRRESSPVVGSFSAQPAAPAPENAQNPALATPEALLEVRSSKEASLRGAVRRNIFEYGPRPQTRRRPAPQKPPQPAVDAPSKPATPPAPVRFYGFSEGSRGGERRVFLTDGEEIYVAGEGEVILRRYRVARIRSESIELEELAGRHRWVLPLEQP